MENKNWTNAGINGVAAGPKPVPAFVNGGSSAAPTPPLADVPESFIRPVSPAQLQKASPPPRLSFWQRNRIPLLTKILIPILSVVLLIAGSIIVLSQTNKSTNLAVELQPAEIQLDKLDIANNLGLQGSPSLVVNSRLVSNGGVIITPSSQPAAASTGQIYYDNTTNQLAYFDGIRFIPIGESLSAGAGLSVVNSTITNTGVTSLGQLTGAVALGPGLSGTNGLLQNTGVIGIVGGSGIIIDNNGGVITVSGGGNNTSYIQGGNSFGATAVLGTSDANNLNLVVNSTPVITLTTDYHVGVNTTTPTSLLQVNQHSTAPGTVSNGAASTAVTGTATTFLTTFQPGDTFTITSSGNNCVVQQILTNTSLICRTALASATSGSAYSFTSQTRFAVADNGTASLPGTVILSNPYGSSARFSIRSDDTTNNLTIGANIIGNASDDGGSDTNTDYIQASQFNSGTGGTIDSVRVCFTNMDAVNKGFRVAVYSDNAGSPHTRLSPADTPDGVGAVGWSTVSLGTTLTLEPNTNYWIAFSMQVGVTSRYCRQDGGTTKYQSGFAWGADFPAIYNVTDITSTTVGAYAPYVTITDHSALTSAISVSENNEVGIRPLYNSDSTFQVFRKDGSVIFSANTIDRYAFASQLMVGAADNEYSSFFLGNQTKGVIGARRTTNTTTASIMELFSDVGGAGTMQFKIQADGTVRVGNPAADTTGALVVLDTKNTSGDPTGVNGGMYYNSASNTFRCFENNAWYDCVSRHKIVLGSDVTDNAGACTNTDIPGLSFSVTSGQVYRFHALIEFDSAATTTGALWSATTPANNFFSLKTEHPTSSTTNDFGNVNTSDGGTCSGASFATTGNLAKVDGMVSPSANGTLQLRMASEIDTSAVTVKAGSTLEWW
ncbi:MAG TPA: choice-of-anchor R domain-containing protein [Magnetospirillaceae bacterium]|nr:choice-of-anchor R domain-containing protein [Magnetospirillaceae bacterium]